MKKLILENKTYKVNNISELTEIVKENNINIYPGTNANFGEDFVIERNLEEIILKENCIYDAKWYIDLIKNQYVIRLGCHHKTIKEWEEYINDWQDVVNGVKETLSNPQNVFPFNVEEWDKISNTYKLLKQSIKLHRQLKQKNYEKHIEILRENNIPHSIIIANRKLKRNIEIDFVAHDYFIIVPRKLAYTLTELQLEYEIADYNKYDENNRVITLEISDKERSIAKKLICDEYKIVMHNESGIIYEPKSQSIKIKDYN